MNAARDEILCHIKSALRDVSADEHPEDVTIAREYRCAGNTTHTELIEQFIERLVDYKAKVQCISEAQLPNAIAATCAARGVRRLVVPADLPQTWEPVEITLLRDDGLTNQQLDESEETAARGRLSPR